MIGSRHNRRSTEREDATTETFTPIAYSLDGKRVLDLPLKLTTTATGGAQETHPTTIAGALYDLAPSRENETSTSIQELLTQAVRAIIHTRDAMRRANDGEVMVGTAYETGRGEIVLTGAQFHRQVLTTLLDFGKDELNPFGTAWFWYESQSRSAEATEWVVHSFFVVDGDRIVRECVTFVDDRDSAFRPSEGGFTPAIFVRQDDHDSGGDYDPRGIDTVLSDNAWREASLRFWYRRFYQQTSTGQLMVLRPDEPTLHHFPEGRWQPEAAFAVVENGLARIRTLLWILVILAAFGVLALWR